MMFAVRIIGQQGRTKLTVSESEMPFSGIGFVCVWHITVVKIYVTFLGPNGSCLIAAVSPTDTVDSRNIRTLSTSQIAFPVAFLDVSGGGSATYSK